MREWIDQLRDQEGRRQRRYASIEDAAETHARSPSAPHEAQAAI